MAAVAGHKTVAAPWNLAQEVVKVTYDYSVDGGATGALDLLTTSEDVIIKDFHLWCEAAASGASGTLIVGVSGGDTDSCLDVTSGAVTALTLDAVVGPEATVPHFLAANGKLIQTISTAAFTAGKIHYYFTLMRP